MLHADDGHGQIEQALAGRGAADFILLQGDLVTTFFRAFQNGVREKPDANAVQSKRDDGHDLAPITPAAREDREPVTVQKEDLESADPTDIGISSENRGGFFTVDLPAGNVVEPTLLSTSEFEMPVDSLLNTTLLIVDREETQETQEKHETQKAQEKSIVEETPPIPIVGHRLGVETPSLSDAIDVLFYGGGDLAVSGFELGKDLLWFSLTPDQVSSAQSEMANEGDLVITFEDLGSLTLIGVLDGLAATELV